MGRFRILFKSTALRLSALYILLFITCASLLVFYVSALSEQLLSDQIQEAMQEEITKIQNAYDVGGVDLLLKTLDQRSRQPGANLYVIASPTGELLAGNVASVETDVLNGQGWTITPFHYRRYVDDDAQEHTAIGAIFNLENGLRILVGRDQSEPDRFRVLVRQALIIALSVMGLGALIMWVGIGRNALKRIDRMSHASKRIMAGDLSQRLPIIGSGDEFDRLSFSLNNMLEKIEKLNEGLRQVSDNIAHDLKTPLTRLRNKAVDSLNAKDAKARRAALESITMEADQLIRVFNALLMISRVEAGSMAATLSPIDLSKIVEDSIELYEPVAEEENMLLVSSVRPDLKIQGNRELIGQALFNLLDNAIKYSSDVTSNRKVDVALTCDNNNIRLSVSDYGSGIPAEKRSDVTKRFVRLDKSRSKPGTGLGLSLVSAVIELHGGRMELSDTNTYASDHRGLTVTLIFPLTKP